jgi:hypothetical protein
MEGSGQPYVINIAHMLHVRNTKLCDYLPCLPCSEPSDIVFWVRLIQDEVLTGRNKLRMGCS